MTATLSAPAPTVPGTRLGWLDALRGYAALVVVLFHLSPTVIGADRHMAVFTIIDLGKYGVLLFFLVSGYVIPMSLERHGSLRRFWIGRLFRIYPAYVFAVLLLMATTAAVPAVLRTETVSSVLAHATMLSDLVGLRGAVRPFWTLSYEMVFYLVVAGLFAWRLHRHSAWWACGLALTALIAGPVLPDDLLSPDFGTRRITAAVLLLLVAAAVAGFLTGRDRVAGLIGIGFVVLVAVNGHAGDNSTVTSSRQGLLLLAVMFAGTVVHRSQHRQLDRRATAAALAVVTACVAVAGDLSTATVTAVVATFAAAFALRHRPVPRILVGLGTISYSLYVLHVVVLMAAGRLVPGLASRPGELRVLVGALILAVALAVATLAHRFVELPGQALGRRVDTLLTTQRAAPRTGRGEDGTGSV